MVAERVNSSQKLLNGKRHVNPRVDFYTTRDLQTAVISLEKFLQKHDVAAAIRLPQPIRLAVSR